MKRGIAIGAALTLSILALVGPLTAQAVPPYLYACVPASAGTESQTYALHLYNTVGTTANITAKVLSRTNAHLSTLINPATFTIAGGQSKAIVWTGPSHSGGFMWDPARDATAAEVVRVTSDQPLVVGLSRYVSSQDDSIQCLPTTF